MFLYVEQNNIDVFSQKILGISSGCFIKDDITGEFTSPKAAECYPNQRKKIVPKVTDPSKESVVQSHRPVTRLKSLEFQMVSSIQAKQP